MLMMSMADVVEERREVQLGMAQNIVAADMAISYDKKEDGQTRRNEAEVSTITLQAWNPNADYIAALKHVEDTKMYELYMELKTKYRESPSFYMDVADYFGMQGLKAEALTILSNLAELKMEDAEMMRSLGRCV